MKMLLTPREWGLIEALFPDAAELGDAARRQFLDRHCTHEPGVRAELEAMLTATDNGTSFMAQPVAVSAPGAVTQGLTQGAALGPWKILSLIGRGGMGEVYLAERADGVYAMRTAIKVLKRGLDTAAIVDRFLRERRILAQLSHPNIARVVDAGSAEDGRPYLVMEHVEGAPITAHCREHSLSVRQIAGLMRTVAEAVAEAHRQHIVHRDLKPSNVLVTESGQIKLLDFGIAKLLAENDDATRGAADLLPLTPAYAAPEQILGQTVTPAVDVYALGTMLYLLFTGRLPQLREGLPAVVVAMGVRDEVAKKPSTAVLDAEGLAGFAERKRLAHELAGDLDWIVLKALHPEPRRRYSSAAGLADDLNNYLEHRPVQARPDSRVYRTQRFLRRHALPVAAATIAVLGLITGLAGALWQARIALSAEAEAKKALATAKAVSEFVTQDLLASVDADLRSTANITLKEMLEIAVGQVDKRFADQPQVAAELHDALGKSYGGLGMQQERHDQHEKAAALFERFLGRNSEQTLEALNQLSVAKKRLDDLAGALVIMQELVRHRTQSLGADHPKTLMNRLEASASMHDLGDWPAALAECEAVVEAMTRNAGPADDLKLAQMTLGSYLSDAAEYEKAESLYRSLRASLKETPAKTNLIGPRLDMKIASLLTDRGRYPEAEEILSRLRTDLPKQVPAGHHVLETLEFCWALLRLEQGGVKESIALAQVLLQSAIAKEGAEGNLTFDPLIVLADAYLRSGQYQAAIAALHKIEAIQDKLFDQDQPGRVTIRTLLADALRGAGQMAAATEALNSISPIALSRLPARHPYEAERLRVQALLWLQAGQSSEARKALAESLHIYEFRLGPNHWRSQRAREELARAS